jgi:hypothetical protein
MSRTYVYFLHGPRPFFFSHARYPLLRMCFVCVGGGAPHAVTRLLTQSPSRNPSPPPLTFTRRPSSRGASWDLRLALPSGLRVLPPTSRVPPRFFASLLFAFHPRLHLPRSSVSHQPVPWGGSSGAPCNGWCFALVYVYAPVDSRIETR